METLCFKGNYTKRFARCREFIHRDVEGMLDRKLEEFCNKWLQEEFVLQSGAEWYERSESRDDRRNGHYWRRLVTTRGVFRLKVPRGERKRYHYSLFEKNKRKTKGFEDVVVDALLKGHSSRKASKFFANLYGAGTISHQAAVSTLKKFDLELAKWKEQPVRDNSIIIVLDAVHLKGAISCYKTAKPVLCAYAVYENGHEEVLDFEIERGESLNAWHRICMRLYERGLKNVRLVVHDDNAAISQAVSLVWPKALDQQCIFHILQNMNKKLVGCVDKKGILADASELYQAQSEEEVYQLASKFQKKWRKYKAHAAIKYFFKMLPKSIKYLELPREYWSIAKTSNRLERLFEELKRRIKVFRRFPNPQSCRRWLYALLKELNKANLDYALYESQQSS
jgi:transposase-like protein